MLEPGTVLCTKDGRKFSNAIVLFSRNNANIEEYATYTIMTDFGNKVSLSRQEIDNLFYIVDYCQTVETWKLSRIKLMISDMIF